MIKVVRLLLLTQGMISSDQRTTHYTGGVASLLNCSTEGLTPNMISTPPLPMVIHQSPYLANTWSGFDHQMEPFPRCPVSQLRAHKGSLVVNHQSFQSQLSSSKRGGWAPVRYRFSCIANIGFHHFSTFHTFMVISFGSLFSFQSLLHLSPTN